VGENIADDDGRNFRLRPYANSRQRNECILRKFRGKVRKFVLVRIADDETDALEPGDFFGRTLRITSGDDNASCWIATFYAANRSSRILVGGGGDGAGVEHDHFGVVRRNAARKAAFQQLALNRRAVCLRRTAPEVLDKETAHGVIIRSNGRLPSCAGSRILRLRQVFWMESNSDLSCCIVSQANVGWSQIPWS
jgi:hypothetical protein